MASSRVTVRPRGAAPDGEVTAYFASLNRNKKSVVLDLKNPDGAALMAKLVEKADVFVTNMRAAALERLNLHPEQLRARFPRLIVASISGFGMKNAGEHADRAGLAIVAEAMSGATGLTRDHEGNPVWCGFALGDITASVSAHAAILLALRNQERYGVGKLIDLGLVECMLPMVSVAMGRVQVEGDALSDFSGSNTFHGIPYGAFPASDGGVSIGCNRDDFWRRLCVAMGKPELGTDPRYGTYAERSKRQREVHDLTEAFTRAHTRAEIVAKLIEADVPVAAIHSMKEVINDENLRGRGALWEVEDGYGGTFTLPANTSWLEHPLQTPRVPRLGEHRDVVLGGGTRTGGQRHRATRKVRRLRRREGESRGQDHGRRRQHTHASLNEITRTFRKPEEIEDENTTAFGRGLRGPFRRRRTGANVSRQARQDHHAVPDSHRAGHRHASRRRAIDEDLGPAGHHREPPGRQRLDRDGSGQAFATRRLHAAASGRTADDHRTFPVEEAAVRPGEGLRSCRFPVPHVLLRHCRRRLEVEQRGRSRSTQPRQSPAT